MISIIVCSTNENTFNTFQLSVSATIGVDFEIIKIADAAETGGMCAAFNKGASKAKYPYLCFCHDDIIFHTKNWGFITERNLNNQLTGIIAVAGAVCKTAAPSPWWISNFHSFPEYYFSNVIQHLGGILQQPATLKAAVWNNKEILVADGVWMCCRKDVWESPKFDEKTFTGFHFYDLDFSIALHKQGYKNYLTTDILIEHSSAGNTDRSWIEAAIKFHNKWKNSLPLFIDITSNRIKKQLEKEALKNWLITLNQNSNKQWFKYWMLYFLKYPFNKTAYSLLFNKIKRN